EYFSRHLDLARRLDLPFIVHCRDAEADVVAQLRDAAKQGPLRGIMHSFAGDAQTARACVELGLHISFSGMVTFPKNEGLRAAAAVVPLDRLLVETDAPYLAPQKFRGKRNEPSYVQYTVAKLAEVRGMTAEELGDLTAKNARELFRIA
ncbi:MAG: TatD family hydrolase, partial [Planctomycetaceae bacterium]